ncbi:MAG TPA: Fe-S cluster assembly protein SufD [Patescibacteria group bacterium]|nr:Fe-S cluster assembly protein SufD [Patescibacteria group bacterium]
MSGLQHALFAAAPERLADLALPGPRDERWRYSSLRALNARTFTTAPTTATPLGDAMQARIASLSPRLVFVDGRHDATLSDLAALGDALTLDASAPSGSPPPHWPFARAAAVAAPTLALHISAACATPIHLLSITTAAAQDAVVQQSLHVELAPGAEASIVHHRLGESDGTAFVNLWRDLALADGAHLHWLETADEGERASVVIGTHAVLAASARFELAEVAAGAALYRHDLDATLAGEQSELIVRGCTMVTKRRHADVNIDARHRAKNTRADIVWRGLADQRGHAIFAGQLIVEEGADGADAGLSNKNLLLSPHAEIDTRPVLEIYADEVKAAHGATVGRLDEGALFYLRSRGIGESEARRILQLAFAREPLLQLPDARIREFALAALAHVLPEEAT